MTNHSVPITGDVLLFVPGSRYTDVAGTDRCLAEALSEFVTVVWVDPPESIARPGGSAWPPFEVRARGEGLLQFRSVGPPGSVAKPGSRHLTVLAQDALLRRTLRSAALRGVVSTSPFRRPPKGLAGPLLYFVTDDWQAGSSLMGLPPRLVRSTMRRSVAAADLLAAVSPALSGRLAREFGRDFAVLPNGCRVTPPGESIRRDPKAPAALIGQLNERLDLDLLEALSDRGVNVTVAGPNRAKNPDFERRLDVWLSRPEVTWLGELPAVEIPRLLAGAVVGLTPYVRSEFNDGSFPLKTLEYLANGLAVVSTDLSSARWLASCDVDIARTVEEYVDRVVFRINEPLPERSAKRRDFAMSHTWQARARTVLDLLDAARGDLRTGQAS